MTNFQLACYLVAAVALVATVVLQLRMRRRRRRLTRELERLAAIDAASRCFVDLVKYLHRAGGSPGLAIAGAFALMLASLHAGMSVQDLWRIAAKVRRDRTP
jgi:hypothetical protein